MGKHSQYLLQSIKRYAADFISSSLSKDESAFTEYPWKSFNKHYQTCLLWLSISVSDFHNNIYSIYSFEPLHDLF